MPDKARGVALSAAGNVLTAVASSAAAVDRTLHWGRRQWWGRLLP
jgi:hypothetical protein